MVYTLGRLLAPWGMELFVNRSIKSRFCLASIVALVACQAIAADFQKVKVIQGKPANEITTDIFFPQVNERKRGPSRPRAENDHVVIPGAPKNTLPLGRMSGQLDRGRRAARFPGMSYTGWFPPDCDIAVGPEHIVQVVNSDLAFFTKDGSKIFQQGQASFFSGLTSSDFIFDAKTMYDPFSGRFFIVTLNLDFGAAVSRLLLAVSDDSDPNGVWRRYAINSKLTVGGTSYWFDYPGFGFTKDGIALSGNMFGFSGGFAGAYIATLNKAPLLTGAAPTITYFHQPDAFSIQFARTYSSDETTLYGAYASTTAAIDIVAITGLPDSPAITSASVPVTSFDFPPFEGVPSTGGRTLDALDGRLLNVAERNGALVTAHAIVPNSGPDSGKVVSRWYEFSTNGWPTAVTPPTLKQSGNVQTAGAAFMPAISLNIHGDIGMVYTRSSQSICADILFSARKKTDDPGVMGSPNIVSTSLGSVYGPFAMRPYHRWGDYFAVDVDPVDNSTFWVYGMMAGPTPDDWWHTFVAKYVVSTGGVDPGQTVFPGNITMVEGKSFTGGLASVLVSDNAYFNIASASASRLGQVASARSTYQLTKPSNELTALNLALEATGAPNVTCLVFLYNWNTQKHDHMGSFPLGGVEQKKKFKLSALDWSQYVNGAKELRVVTRALSPNSTYSTATPFNYKIDEIKIELP